MADHSKPTLSSTYPDFLAEVKGRLEDVSRQFDPANSESSNLVMGAVRWTSAAKKWEIWSGTSWGNLATEYAISISGSAAKLKTARSIALTGGATAAAVNFDGSANITLNVTELNPAQLSAAIPLNKGGTGASDVAQARANLGLGTAATTSASDYAAKSHTHSWGEITGKPTAFPPASHSHDWGSITGKPTTFSPSAHTHAWGQITGAPATATRWPSWGEVTGKPAIYSDLNIRAVGTYCFVSSHTGTSGTWAPGATIPGAHLREATMLWPRSGTSEQPMQILQSGTNFPGTWRIMGGKLEMNNGTIRLMATLAVRIS